MARPVSLILALLLLCGGVASAEEAGRAAPAVVVPTAVAGEHYVPIHSSVRAGDGRTRIDLAVTLSVHNASETRPLVVTRIDYFDGAGHLVEHRLDKPVTLAPFATHEVFVAKADIRGGTGANFVVGWAADRAIAVPVIEAVMIGDFGNQSYAFVSEGRRIVQVAAKAH
jgi:hypothetical protein